MAKALKYFYEFSDIDADDYKVEIWVEGFAGSATELKAGGNPLTRTYNKDVGEKYLGGIVPFVVNIEAISSSSFHAVDFTGENYGDAVVVVYKNATLQYNAIIVPFEGSDADLNDGIYSVNLSAECGLVNLKTINYVPSNTRKKLLNIIIECINNIPYINSFGYSVVDNVDLKDADGFTQIYYQSFIEDSFFEGLSCYDVLNNIIQQYSQLSFTDARWDIKNISEISKGNSVKKTYSSAGVLQSTTNYTRPTEEVIRLAGGSFGLMFSSKTVIIEKTKSIARSLNPNSGFNSPTGWTFAGSASSYFTIENGYLTNNAYTRFTTDTSPDDLSYVQSPATTYYPFNSIFDLSAKQELKVKFKSTKGLYIKHLRLQIVAVQGIIGAGDNIYYLTNEGTWYRSVPGYNTPIYQANFENNNDQIITIPQVPYIVPGTAPLEYNTIPDLGEFVSFPYNQPDVNAPYNIYVRVFLPERLYETYAPGTTDLDVTTEIDYVEITAEDVSTDILNGFTKKFGVVTQKDRNGDFTIKLGVGYPSYPISYDSLFFDGTTTKPIITYNDLPIEEFIAESYLSVLSQRQKFYQGTVIANIEFGDLLDIDGEKHRIHNFEYNYKLKQANVKTIGLGVNTDTIEELPVYDVDIDLDINSILSQVNIDMNRRYGDNLNLKFVDKNIEIKTLADGQKTLSLRQDFRINTLYSTDVFLRAASEGSIQDVAEDTAGNFTIIKPAKDGTYALLEDIEDLAWLQAGNTATVATKKLGTLDNFDFNIIRNNINIGQIKSTGLDLLDNRLDVGAVQFNVATAQTVGVAKTIWNNTFGTLEFGLKGGNVTYRLGQSSIVYVKNADNSGLTKGTVVYTAGSDGINKTVRLGQANAESTSSKTFGIIAETASGGSKAFCITFGNIEGIDTSALTEGATVYLSPTVAGGMTTTKPSAPNHMVVVGFCLRSHATLGVIFVKVQNGFELDELHDVSISALANNNLLTYEAGTTLWKNKSFADLGLTTGTGTLNYVPKWSNATGGLTNSQIFDNGVNVGIGVVTPAQKLHVLSTTAFQIQVQRSGVASAFIGLSAQTVNSTGDLLFEGAQASQGFVFRSRDVNNSVVSSLGIDRNGNVGIGTFTPASKLHVVGQVSASLGSLSNPAYSFINDLNTGLFSPSVDTLALVTNGVNRLNISNVGDVVIAGKTVTTNFSMISGAAAGRILQSDASGNASWVTLNTSGYLGTWNANTNTPTIANGTGTAGQFYIVTVAGTWNSITFAVGDQVYYNGTIWQRIPSSFTLPVATASVLGGVKISTGLTINAGGDLSVSYGTTSTTAATGDHAHTFGGDVSGSGGTGTIALTLATVNSNVGQFTKVTVNAKGLVTAAESPSTVAGYGITDVYTETESDARYVALSGSYSNPTWITALSYSKLTNVPSTFAPAAHTLDSHSNVTITSNLAGEVLKWDGTAWVNNTLAEAGIQATLSGTGLVLSTAGVITYITDNSSNWNTAFTERNRWDGGATGLVAATGRTSLGLVIGTDVQAYDADLQAIGALAATSGILRKTAANTWSLDTTSYLTTPTTLTTNYVSKWNGSIFANSQIFDNGASVGIAISSPSATSKLHVNNAVGNSVRFQNTYFSNTLEVNTGFARGGIFNNAEYIDEGGASKVWKIRNIGANDAAGILFGNSGTLNFISVPNVAAADRSLTHAELLSNAKMTILATGFVGINTTTPAYTLDVTGTIRTASILITSGATVGSFLKATNVNGTSAWSSITTSDISNLSSWTGSTSITTLGTITSGTWNGTAIGTTRGGTGLTALGTANQILRVNAGATALEYFTPTYISGNQAITLSGIVTGSGTTAITTAIADGALSIAKTSGLQTALDAKQSTLSGTGLVLSTAGVITYVNNNSANWDTAFGWGNHASAGYLTTSLASTTYQPLDGDLTAIAGLVGTSGFLKKTAVNTWTLDTNSYLTGNQTISITGDATGSGTTAITLTLANVATAGTYRSVTVNAKGLVTAGTNPTTISGYGITDFYSQVVSGFVTGANSSVLNTDTLEVALEKLQGQINARITGNQTINITGDVSGSGTTAITATLATITQASTGDFRKVTIDTKGRVTGNTAVVIGDLTALGAITLGSLSSTATGLSYSNSTGVFSMTSGYTIPTTLSLNQIAYADSSGRLIGSSTLTLGESRYINLNLGTGNAAFGVTSTGNNAFIQSPNGNLRLEAGINDTYSNTVISISNHEFLKGIRASGSYGTAGQVLSSTGTGVQWITGSAALTNTYIGFGSEANVVIGNSRLTWDTYRINISGGTGSLKIGKGGLVSDLEYWIDAPNTNLNLYGTSVVSKNNHNFEFKIALGGNYGTAGQVLTSQGSGANPTWTTVSGGTQTLDSVLGIGNTAVNKNLILNGTNSLYDSAALKFQKNGTLKASIFYDNQYISRFLIDSTDKIQINANSANVELYGSATIIGSLSGSGLQMVTVDNNGILGKQAIPSGGGGFTSLTALLANTSGQFSGSMYNSSGGYYINGTSALAGGMKYYATGSSQGIEIYNSSSSTIRLNEGDIEIYAFGGIKFTTAFLNLGGSRVALDSVIFDFVVSSLSVSTGQFVLFEKQSDGTYKLKRAQKQTVGGVNNVLVVG